MASQPQSPPQTYDELLSVLHQRGNTLTRAQRLLADRVMADPEGVAFMTVSELAAAVGVNEATVVRFATSLGLDGYPGLTRLCRERLREQAQLLRRYNHLQQLTAEGGDPLQRAVALDQANIARTFARINPEDWQAAVKALADSPRVHVMGLRKCYAPGYLLGYLLRMLREEVHTVTGPAGGLTDELRGVREGDCFVAISIHRYSAETVKAAAWARSRGAWCLALTDNPSSPLATTADQAFYIDATGPFVLRSLTAFTSLVQALATGVAQARGHEARSTLLREEELLETFSVYEAREE
ncbi:MurR/RpiR family transcriptional regulator [Streptomyces sp. NPDC044780]|uniref:MurR/RpiR family transcriptional regulator n=1 Tax=unclassified Streptomyces TaxID=2593676 RepID=UPI003410C323